MARLCELCGAKLRSEDDTCRECGMAVGPRRGSQAAADARAAEAAVVPDVPAGHDAVPRPRPIEEARAVTMPVASTTDDPALSRRGGALGWVVGAVAVVGVAAAAAWWGLSARQPDDGGTDDASPTELAAVAGPSSVRACAQLAALAGEWTFHTEVVASRVLSSSGLTGFYELHIDPPADDCRATARIVKTGYTARHYPEAQQRRAEAQLTAGTGLSAHGVIATFELRSQGGDGVDVEFVFAAAGERLSGTYRQRGPRWATTGLSGFLEGARAGDVPNSPLLADQSCAVRCAVVCDVAHRDDLAPTTLDACVSGCDEATLSIPTCPDAIDLPATQTMSLRGPASLDELCKPWGGCRKKVEVGSERAPVLGAKRFDGGITGARFVQPKGAGPAHLAIRTEAGWYVSAALGGEDGEDLQMAKLYGRHLGEGQGRRWLMGLLGTGGARPTETFVACRVDGDAPRCIQIAKDRSSYVSLLPGALVSVGAREGDAAGALPPGVYRW
jgi:hypothetical protein